MMEKPASSHLRTNVASFTSALLVVLGARCLRMGFKTWGDLASFELGPILAFLAIYVAAFVCIVMALAGPPDALLDRLCVFGSRVADAVRRIPAPVRRVLVVLNTVGPVVSVVWIVGRRIATRWGVDYFGTDGLLFAQYAVDSLFEGKNPYALSMAGAFQRYAADVAFGTYRIDGSLVTELSYPAMSIWAFVPQYLLKIPHFDLTSLVVLMVVFVWLVVRAPLLVKWAAPGMLWAEWGIVSFTAGGVFDILWTLPVVASMVAFAKRRLLLAGALFGIACSVKQTPWFIAPFLILWLLLEARDKREWLRNALIFGGASTVMFVIINAPFMINDFGAWMRGVLVPVAGGAPLVELGGGPVMFNIAGMAHAPKLFFSLLMAAAFALTAIAYTLWFDWLKWLAFSSPMLVLWFNYRSLHNYYVYLLPAVLMGVLLKYESVDAPTPKRRRPALKFAAACGLAAVLLAIAFVTLSPRTVLNAHATVTGMSDPDLLGRISEFSVDVTNDEPTSITPTFGIVHSGHQTPVHWTVNEGPAALPAGATASYVLAAPMPTATVPYDASMHLRVYDRGTERRTSVVIQHIRHGMEPPAIANKTFQRWVLNAENAHTQPLSWTVKPSPVLPPQNTSVTYDEGLVIAVHGADSRDVAAQLLQSNVEQVVKHRFNELLIDATPGNVANDLETPQTMSGFELRTSGYCILGIFVAQATITVTERTFKRNQCKVIGIPATAGQRLTAHLALEALVGAPHFAHFFKTKTDTRLVLFAAVSSTDEEHTATVRFHEVYAP